MERSSPPRVLRPSPSGAAVPATVFQLRRPGAPVGRRRAPWKKRLPKRSSRLVRLAALHRVHDPARIQTLIHSAASPSLVLPFVRRATRFERPDDDFTRLDPPPPFAIPLRALSRGERILPAKFAARGEGRLARFHSTTSGWREHV